MASLAINLKVFRTIISFDIFKIHLGQRTGALKADSDLKNVSKPALHQNSCY